MTVRTASDRKAAPSKPAARLMTEQDIDIERKLAIIDHNLHESGASQFRAEAGARSDVALLGRVVCLSELYAKQANLLSQQASLIKTQIAEIADLKRAIVILHGRDENLARAGSAAAQATTQALADIARRIGCLEAGLGRGSEAGLGRGSKDN